jgi:hypothetical protein
VPIPADYEERVYAGVLGKIIGVYLGRPFEGWSYDRIMERLGEVQYYVHERLDRPLVVTDDDISGTFTFLRALPDHGNRADLSPREIGRTWLNYIIENQTILWWGGMGNSTEHTAYLRLKSGINAPESGSIALNGKTVAEQIGESWLNYIIERRTILWWGGLGNSTEHTAYLRLQAGTPAPASGSAALNGQIVAEQIGAQIFIDGWAMVAPGDPELAADLAGGEAGGVAVVRQGADEGERAGDVVVGDDEGDAALLVDVVVHLAQLAHDLLVAPALEGAAQVHADDLTEHAGVDALLVVGGDHNFVMLRGVEGR